MVQYDPVPGGGISMAPLRFSEKATVSHEEPSTPAPKAVAKSPAKRKPKEG